MPYEPMNPFPPGYEWDYVQFTAPVGCVGTTEATATTIVTGNAVNFDGAPVIITFGCDYVQLPSNVVTRLWLYEDGVSIGELAVFRDTDAATALTPPYVQRRHTPSAGVHTYSVRGSTASGTFTIDAGAGGAGNPFPGYLRITKV